MHELLMQAVIVLMMRYKCCDQVRAKLLVTKTEIEQVVYHIYAAIV